MKKLLFLFAIMMIGLVSAQVVTEDGFNGNRAGTASYVSYGSSFTNYYGAQASTYWPILSNRDQCTNSQDIVVQVSPLGCQPAVVRSDLIAEQNVPVFCQLDLLQINPAIDVKQIRNIRFSGNYPKEVAGVGFHPANAALRTTSQLLGTPLQSNIGYVVVVLKRNPDEKTLPEFFNFTLSASVDYYSGNSIGIGTSELLLRETTEEDWKVAKNKQTFFGGKFSVRLRDSDTNSVNLELYSGDVKYSSITLQKNQVQPNSIYLPGSYCQTTLQFSYSDFVSPPRIARLQVDDNTFDLYEGSKFLNNRCTVRKVSGDSINGSVELNCGQGPIMLSNSAQLLKVNDKVYKVGDDLKVITSQEYIIKNIITTNNAQVSYELEGQTQPTPSDRVRPIDQTELYDATYGVNEEYILNATRQYELLADSYGNEKKNDFGESYGELALSRAIRLADTYGKKNTAVRLIDKYLQNYPDGKDSAEFVRMLNNMYARNSVYSGTSVETEDGFHVIKLLDVSGSGKKSGATVSWGNDQKEITEGATVNFGSGNLTLISVRDAETIEIDSVCNPGVRDSKHKGLVSLNQASITSCGSVVRVSNIDWQNYVKLRISPVTRSSTVGNFTVGIGIEKRAIELTPSKAQKKIENLNGTIKKWESISNNLGEVVTGLKGACFATAGVLTVKNFFTGLSGEALARRDLMSGDNGWTKVCQDEISNGQHEGSLTVCYNSHSLDIAKDVEARTSAIKKTNDVTTQIEKDSKYPSREGVFAGESFNDIEARQALITRIRNECRTVTFGDEPQPKTVGSLLPTGQTVSEDEAKQYSYSQLRDIYFNCQTINSAGSPQGTKKARTDLAVIGKSVEDRKKYEQDVTQYNGVGLYTLDDGVKGTYSGETVNTLRDKGFTNLPSDVSGDTSVQVVRGRDKTYLITLDKNPAGYQRNKIYPLADKNVGSAVEISTSAGAGGTQTDLTGLPSTFDLVTAGSYYNSFAPGETTVRYFETEPYKGSPAVVPFDLTRGFYAATTQSLPLLGATKSFEENGRPSSFFVCNVMADKRVGFYAPNYGDDECVQFNIYTGQPFTAFPGLTETDTKRLVTDAVKALEEAAQQYGKKTVRIRGNTINVGNAASLLPGTQCQDYMSPEDCKILFNVCDPVICPTSRCNFGGEYYVSDVIQSGIVGSALLCLPNYKEGIAVPVCLTGIKAGIDGYLSILKSHQQCLQEAVDTGKYVGICDQISSVYMCEFFWRQAAPLAKAVLPKLVEYAYTGGQENVRGGGEYLTVQSSWQNAQDSVGYFTQNYAANSLEAFRVRSVEEAGTEICRAFISVKGPKTFETLIEPDSPPQFHAWYSAIDYTDVTIPATAQYKVFYHIFAGNDIGVSYSVYLKDPPADTQYSTNPIVVVQTGFVARAQYATESKDFTAPKGYKQLCVRINDKEECGFKQVSSSFAVDYVKDSIVADQLTQTDIATEAECVSGSVSPAALLNPNLGSAVGEAIDPAIYNRGIVRICATSNPGSSTDPTRFVKVGVCGESRLGCWLDKNSISKTIESTNVGLKDQTLSELERIQKGNFNDSNDFESSEEIKDGLVKIQNSVKTINSDKTKLAAVLESLDQLMVKAFWNYDKAEILFWKAQAFETFFGNSIDKLKISGASASTTELVTPPVVSTPESSGERVLSFEGNYEESRIVYLKLGGENTKIFFSNRVIKIKDLFGSVTIGEVRDGKIIFTNDRYKDEINKIFGPGSYDFFNERLLVENIRNNCDLDILESCTGSASIPETVDTTKILSLSGTYQQGRIVYLMLEGQQTNIFFGGPGNVYYYPSFVTDYIPVDAVIVGSVFFSSQELSLSRTESTKEIIDRELGEGAFDKINNARLTIVQIQNGFELI